MIGPNLMPPLKICIFTETFFPEIGGGETQAKLLAEGLIDRGNSVIILTRRSAKAQKKFERVGQVPVYRLAPAGSGQLKKWGLILSSFPYLIRLHKQYDLIFVSGFRIIGITAVLMSKLLNKSCILKADSQGEMSGEFFTHGLEKLGISPAFLPFKIFLKLRNLILKKADGFAVISSDIVTEMSSARIPSQKIHLIPNSVDTDRFFPVNQDQKSLLRGKLGLPEKATIVIYTGRLVSYKGLPLLLQVWQALQNDHKDALLLLVGSGGLDIHNCEAELRSFVSAHGLGQSVHFTGSVQNVAEFLQASDIFAFPTENDAFPSSLVEAMTCGLPVVTTPVGAIKTVIKDQQNGLLVQPGDYQQLYQALDTLMDNSALASRLGQSAWKTVHDHYSAKIVTDKYLTLFINTMGPSFSGILAK
jgi:glycosyltransferase involved in cell wall biosynthesis